MLEHLAGVLVAIVIFAVIAYGLYWVCTKFFPNFPPALWICGAVLLIIILYYLAHEFAGAPLPALK
jgi:hypothetical protein